MLLLLCLPITFLSHLFTQFTDILTIGVGYFLLKSKRKTDIRLLNNLILCMLLNYEISLMSSGIMIVSFSSAGIKSYFYVFIQLSLKVLLFLLFILSYKKLNFQVLLEKYSLKITTGLMLYLFFISLFTSYTMHYYEMFNQFILGVISFLIA